MSPNLKQINATEHKTTRINLNIGYPQAANINHCMITVREFDHGAANFPIVLVKDDNSDSYSCAAILGLENGENLFSLERNGSTIWSTTFVPALIARYPFALGRLDPKEDDPNTPDMQTMAVCLAEDNRFISETEGERLFDDAGNETPFFAQRKQLLGDLVISQRETEFFARELQAKGLITDLEITFTFASGRVHTLNGLSTPDRKAVESLTDAEIADLYRKGIISKMCAMAGSLAQMSRLIHLKNSRSDDKIINISAKTADMDKAVTNAL